MGLFGSGNDDTEAEEKKYFCQGCGCRIPEDEFNRNEGFCDACTLDEASIGGGLI